MSRADNKEKYKEYDHQYYIKHKRPKSKIGQVEQKITDLEAKLEELRKQITICDEENSKTFMKFVDVCRQNAELKQQLAEKEKEIAYMTKQAKKFNNEAQKYFEDAYCNNTTYQDKISFCIEKLEKVKEEMTYNGNGYCEVRQCSSPHTPNLNYAWFNYVVFNKFIDNQIKQLKQLKEMKSE